MRTLLLLMLLSFASFADAQQTYKTESNISYYPDTTNLRDQYIKDQCRLDIYLPQDVRNFATIVWFHGGGITGGRREIPQALKGKGVAVIGVGYRLSPKVTAPAYIEDAAAAIAWAFRNIERYGGNNKLIFISGHSAGGYLGTMVTLDKHYLKKYNVDADSIAALISFSGQAITHFTVRKEQGIDNLQPTIDTYAPLFHVRKNAPPIVLITGDREMELFGRYEENAYLWRMLQLVGHKKTKLLELDGFDHGGMAEPAFPLLLKEVKEISKLRSNQ